MVAKPITGQVSVPLACWFKSGYSFGSFLCLERRMQCS